MKRTCQICTRDFRQRSKVGRPPKYCRACCKQWRVGHHGERKNVKKAAKYSKVVKVEEPTPAFKPGPFQQWEDEISRLWCSIPSKYGTYEPLPQCVAN